MLTEDHHGETVYSINTAPGPLPAETVAVASSGLFDTWNGSQWVKDETAERNARLTEATARQKQLIDSARLFISEWQSELMLGSISDENKAQLQKWLDCIRALKAVDLTSPEWPVSPAG